MIKYIKCPRCELNYIDSEKQEYCDVCIAEMKGNRLQFADLDDEELDEIDAELETGELCPICGINSLRGDEKMCESCRQQQRDYDEEDDVDLEKDEEWKNYLDEDDSDLTIDDEALEEELKAELDQEDGEEDEMYEGEDDDFFESEDVDSLDDFEDDDFDDDDEDDDDDYDF